MKKIGWLAALGFPLTRTAAAQPWRDGPYAPRREGLGRRGAASEMDELDGPSGPMTLPPGTIVERDLAYGSSPSQRLDVYRPPRAADAPVIFMVHGGAWMRGNKSAPRVVNNKVAHWIPKGYIFVSISYRMSPEANPVEQAGDVGKALAFAQSKAKAWGGDPSRFLLVGHSAGGHLVSLLTADPSIATAQGAKPWIGTVSLDTAAFDVVQVMESRHFPFYDEVFRNDRNLWREASPTRRLQRAPVPMLLVCSRRRNDSCAQAEAFAAKAKSLGGRVSVAPVDMTHAEINELLGASGEYTRLVESFMRSLGLG